MRIMRHGRRKAYICGHRCFPLAITLIFVSFNLPRMLQLKSILASSPDKYISMEKPLHCGSPGSMQ